jgi:molecular chaperone DnaK
MGGVFTKIIERNTTIPVKKSQIFSTAEDNQPAVDIKVYQGERPMAADNMLLGEFQLSGIPPAPRGVPKVEVTFDIDANGILNVSAKDKASGKEQQITITASTNLSENEVEQMVEEAEEHRAEDEQRAELIKARNEADALAYQVEKSLDELGDNVPAAEREQIKSQVETVRSTIQGDDIEAIRREMEDLRNASHALAQQAYAQGQQGQQPGATPGGQPGNTEDTDEDVVEGEYSEV